jgi:hypothetical protein
MQCPRSHALGTSLVSPDYMISYAIGRHETLLREIHLAEVTSSRRNTVAEPKQSMWSHDNSSKSISYQPNSGSTSWQRPRVLDCKREFRGDKILFLPFYCMTYNLPGPSTRESRTTRNAPLGHGLMVETCTAKREVLDYELTRTERYGALRSIKT